MTGFEASNGATVSIENLGLRVHDGTIDGGHPNSVLVSSRGVWALREFFRDERDRALGRWRWPENPDYVVYPNVSADSDTVLVLDEASGASVMVTRGQERAGNYLHDAARAYFEAHPEPEYVPGLYVLNWDGEAELREYDILYPLDGQWRFHQTGAVYPPITADTFTLLAPVTADVA